MPATLEPLDNLGYVIKVKDRNLYVINDSRSIANPGEWGDDLADVVVYDTIREAQDIKRNFDTYKSDYPNIHNIVLEVQIIHRKKIMVAKLKGSKSG